MPVTLSSFASPPPSPAGGGRTKSTLIYHYDRKGYTHMKPLRPTNPMLDGFLEVLFEYLTCALILAIGAMLIIIAIIER